MFKTTFVPIFLFAVAFSFFAWSTRAAPVWRFGTVSCFVACGNPPILSNADQAPLPLRSTPYAGMKWLDQVSAPLTSQFLRKEYQ